MHRYDSPFNNVCRSLGKGYKVALLLSVLLICGYPPRAPCLRALVRVCACVCVCVRKCMRVVYRLTVRLRLLQASQCTPLFFAAYNKCGAGAVIHTHSQHAVRATLLAKGDVFQVLLSLWRLSLLCFCVVYVCCVWVCVLCVWVWASVCVWGVCGGMSVSV